MKTQFEQLMTGLDEVDAFLAGAQNGFKVNVPEEVDVKGIRNKLRMTQARFSDTFGFSLDAIKHWEGGRRTPEAPARILLTVISRNPVAVISALRSGQGIYAQASVKRRASAKKRYSKSNKYTATVPKVRASSSAR